MSQVSTFRVFISSMFHCSYRWVQKNHPQTCDGVKIPAKKDGDEFRSTSVLHYIHELHYPSPEEGSEDESDYDYPEIIVDHSIEDTLSINNNPSKDVQSGRTKSRFPFRFKMFGCIGIKGEK